MPLRAAYPAAAFYKTAQLLPGRGSWAVAGLIYPQESAGKMMTVARP